MATFLTVAALQLQHVRTDIMNPGAGIGVEGATNTLHKDGYFHVECLQDEMYEEADKYGENRHSYSNKFNVSIVRYADKVDREDARPMTPLVCFDFCRTIYDMHFFGLKGGRDCYCTPYYERKPSGGGVCDLPCEGDSAKMCGGQEMMDVYEMHMCANTEEDMEKASEAGNKAYALAHTAGTWGQDAAAKFEEAANALKLEANQIGDMSSHDHGQTMKVHAGVVLHAAEKASAAATELNSALTTLNDLFGSDFTKADKAFEAEKAIRDVNRLAEKAQEVGEASTEINDRFYPQITAAAAIQGSGLFVGAMEMIHKWQGDHEALKGATNASHAKLYPTTCEGELAADPIFAVSLEQCAEACNTYTHSGDDNYCIGFQHFYMGDIDVHPAGTTNTAECEDYLGYTWGGWGCAAAADYVQSQHEWMSHILNNRIRAYPDYYSASAHYYWEFRTYYYWGTSEEPDGPCSSAEKREAAYNGGRRCREGGERSIFGKVAYYMHWNFYYAYYYETGDTVAQKVAIYGHDYYDSVRIDEACCASGGGYTPGLPPTPDTGICMLFSSIDHVYQYDCGEPTECVDVDYTEKAEELGFSGTYRTCQSYVDNPSMVGGMMDYLSCYIPDENNRKYTADAYTFGYGRAGRYPDGADYESKAVPFWEGCCEIKEAYPDGIPECNKKKLLLEQNTTNTTKALLSHKHEKTHAKKHERKHKKVAKKESEGAVHASYLAHPPAQLTTPNVCKVRASWNIAAPRKPEFEKLNTCLDTGELVLGNSATGKKKKK